MRALWNWSRAVALAGTVALGFGGVLLAPGPGTTQDPGNPSGCQWYTQNLCEGNDCITEHGVCCESEVSPEACP